MVFDLCSCFEFLFSQSLFLLCGEITRRGIRHYLTTNGQPYTEYIIFKNYDDGVDVYMHNSVWELDLWAYYTIDGPWDPEDWYLATSMTFVRNVVWTHTQIYDSNKRKHDAIGPDEDPISDGMSAVESMYNTAVLAMTPTTMEPGTTHPMEHTVAAMTPAAAEEGEEENNYFP